MNIETLSRILKLDPLIRRNFGGVLELDELKKKVEKQTSFPVIYVFYFEGHFTVIYFGKTKNQFFDSLNLPFDIYGSQFINFLAENHIFGVFSSPVQSDRSIYCSLFCIYVCYCLSRNVKTDLLYSVFPKTDLSKNDYILRAFMDHYLSRFSS